MGRCLTAGIGKTYFGYYLLWQWACRGERVVLRKNQFYGEAPILFCPEGAFMLDEEQWGEEIGDKRTR